MAVQNYRDHVSEERHDPKKTIPKAIRGVMDDISFISFHYLTFVIFPWNTLSRHNGEPICDAFLKKMNIPFRSTS